MITSRDCKIDFFDQIITISPSFSKRANVIGSDEYHTILKLIHDFPNYKIELHRTMLRHTYRPYNPSYQEMERYISTCSVSEEDYQNRMNEFICTKEHSRHSSSPYAFVRRWFINTYPMAKLDFENTLSN